MIIVHYEVYVLEGHGWMLHARFPRSERDAAVQEARELEHSLGARVKVLRETYYTDDNAFEEAEVYASANKAPPLQRSAGPPRSPSALPHTAAAGGSYSFGRPAPRQPQSFGSKAKAWNKTEEAARVRQLLGRMFAVVAVGLAVAMLAIRLTPEAIMMLWRWGFTMNVTPQSYSETLVGVFICSFLVVTLPLAVRFLPRKRRQKGRRSAFSGAHQPMASAEDIAKDRAVRKSLNKLAAKALAEEEMDAQFRAESAKDKAEQPVSEDTARSRFDGDDLPEILPGPDIPEETISAAVRALAEETLSESRVGSTPESNGDTTPPVPTTHQITSTEQEEASTEQIAPTGESNIESAQPILLRFLTGAVQQAKVLMPNMDAYTKFALHLYLAGAAETLCEFKRLGEGGKTRLVTLALETLGTRGELSRKFYEKFDEYLLEPRYLGVVQAGRNAMGDFMLGDESGAHRELRDVLQEWNRKSDKKAQIVTVMFTDMVGSTDMTQLRGDAAAQEVLRRHNAIVRGALAQFGGKEIKHTGDGIMASFATAAAAVEASVAIQRQVSQHNNRQGSSDLHLRIGLNAGEPIEEEDDLFGATVQLAARVCAATNPDEIQCTAVVKDLAAGKGAAEYMPLGDKILKGFKDPVTLFQVPWKTA